jgi:hypothetical protein
VSFSKSAKNCGAEQMMTMTVDVVELWPRADKLWEMRMREMWFWLLAVATLA